MANHPEPGEACERFFSIDELVSIFLHNAPTLVLVNCQRVCTLWRSFIEESPVLQRKLFLAPEETRTKIRSDDADLEKQNPEASEQTMATQERTFNPVVAECFGPILGYPDRDGGEWCSYEHIKSLPWARDGVHRDAPAREAFAREHATWRDMLVCQPPIYRLDWWHQWQTADDRWCGWGHQDLGGAGHGHHPITIGMLWDLVESRLRRGCEAKVIHFPNGQSPATDPTATDVERHWATDATNQHRGFTTTLPRVKIVTRQIWERLPRAHERYNMLSNKWEARHETHGRSYKGDGFNNLRQDCSENRDPGWSQSGGCQWREIDGESSSGPIRMQDDAAYDDEDEAQEDAGGGVESGEDVDESSEAGDEE